jgi:hypothetical protein
MLVSTNFFQTCVQEKYSNKGITLNVFQISSAVRNFKFDSNLKDVSQRSISKLWGLSKMAYLSFEYVSTQLGTCVDAHRKIITLKYI